MEVLRDLFQNKILIISALCWGSAQLIKVLIETVRNEKFSVERLVGNGGMPSSHSATVCGLAMATSRVCGIASPEFAITFVLAAVVISDAMGVRRAAGDQAKVLNELITKLPAWVEENKGKEQPSCDLIASREKELKEFLGHTPMQVFCGALLGTLIAIVFPIK